MIFIYENVIANAIKEKLNIDINSSEYSKTIFSVDSIETESPEKFPFDKTYKGYILVFKNDKPIYALLYTIKSRENIPEQSICTIDIDEPIQASLHADEN